MKSFFENHPLVQAHNEEVETIKAKNYLYAVFGQQCEPLINELNGTPLPFWKFAERAARQEFSQEWIIKRIIDIKTAPEHERPWMIDTALLALNYELHERIKKLADSFGVPVHVRGFIDLSKTTQSVSTAIKAFGESFANELIGRLIMGSAANKPIGILAKHKRRKSPIERIKNKSKKRKHKITTN